MKKIFLFLFVSALLISCDTTTKNQTDKMTQCLVIWLEMMKSLMLWLNSLKHMRH